ncbi:MAG: hypothetical protein CVU56_13340 [Deltaproteobacteria bacterium HGW-Deltaproteobacteria-14]|jgi:ABC-type transport system involved in cytochrome c biogenesis permease subunit|nr:MAG: hypothetical protein CVU56_13340 [Deltaproteobacteria bacterium HGW-Deltaproteobacteria-14]
MNTRPTRALTAALAALALLAPGAASAAGPAPDVDAFAPVLVQHEGRIKPLDTFARHYLLMSAQRNTLDGNSALSWLVDLAVHPAEGAMRPVFKIRTQEVLDGLGMTANPDGHYSLAILVDGIRNNLDALNALYSKPPKERSPVEARLVDLYMAAQQVIDLQQSFSCLRRVLEVRDPDLAAALGVAPGGLVSYRALSRERARFAKMLEVTAADPTSSRHRALLALAQQFQQLDQDKRSALLAIIPPTGDAADSRWRSPWDVTINGGADWQMTLMAELEEAIAAYDAADASGFAQHLGAFESGVRAHIAGPVMSESVAQLEVTYNRADLFKWSIILYILSFILLGLSWLGYQQKRLRIGAGTALALGFVLHLAGVVMRTIIMERPPVTNLYESVVFVGLIGAFVGLWIEWRRRDGIGILAGVIAGASMHFMGFSYASEGDTMGMLVAVLDSNFWLATHVLTITIGYGAVVIAAVFGHVYLIQRILRPGDQAKLNATIRNGVGLALVALFFAVLGTILGGIWADQSWGRFWGWDPKENGALLICLWLLILLHGRLSNIIRDLGFAVGLVLANITVATAWFGVNLLSVGLHSYGFTNSMAFGLLLFCGGEVVFAVGAYIIIKARERNGGIRSGDAPRGPSDPVVSTK